MWPAATQAGEAGHDGGNRKITRKAAQGLRRAAFRCGHQYGGQRALLSVDLALVQLHGDRLTARIALSQALGGSGSAGPGIVRVATGHAGSALAFVLFSENGFYALIFGGSRRNFAQQRLLEAHLRLLFRSPARLGESAGFDIHGTEPPTSSLKRGQSALV